MPIQTASPQSRAFTLDTYPADANRHCCAFFRDRIERYSVVMPFFKEGLDRGEKVVMIIDRATRDEHLSRLSDLGVDVERATAAGQLEVFDWGQAYLRDSRFDQFKMIQLAKETLERARSEGFPGARLMGNMEWALVDMPGVHDIIAYESRLHELLAKVTEPVICAYDLSRFRADLIVDILRVHHTALIDGMVRTNPFFVPPDRYLKEVAER